MARIKQSLSWIATSLVVMVIIATAVLFAWPNSYNVTNGSMVPTIPVGAKVFVEAADDYQPGDVITFTGIQVADHGPIVVTHRLVGFNDDGTLITQGDANKTVDYPAVPVTADDIIGKVVYQLPLVGGLQMWLKSHPLVWIPFVGILLIVFVWPMLGGRKQQDAAVTDTSSVPATASVSSGA